MSLAPQHNRAALHRPKRHSVILASRRVLIYRLYIKHKAHMTSQPDRPRTGTGAGNNKFLESAQLMLGYCTSDYDRIYKRCVLAAPTTCFFIFFFFSVFMHTFKFLCILLLYVYRGISFACARCPQPAARSGGVAAATKAVAPRETCQCRRGHAAMEPRARYLVEMKEPPARSMWPNTAEHAGDVVPKSNVKLLSMSSRAMRFALYSRGWATRARDPLPFHVACLRIRFILCGADTCFARPHTRHKLAWSAVTEYSAAIELSWLHYMCLFFLVDRVAAQNCFSKGSTSSGSVGRIVMSAHTHKSATCGYAADGVG